MAQETRHDEYHESGRRRLLARLPFVLGGLALTTARSAAGADPSTKIRQPGTATAQAFMDRAQAMRRQALDAGDQGYGAVVVKGGRIVGLGPSRVVTNQDPTAHAEMEAIRDAARHLGTRDLSGCVLYATFRPCRMCETAAYWASIDRVFVGREIADMGAPKYGC